MSEAVDVDVLVVGAGISGIDTAYRLQTMCPDTTYAVIEARPSLGGTWDLFRYPGVRSDSDMYTLGFPFEPWTGELAIAHGASILAYVRDTAAKYGIDRRIRYRHKVTGLAWDSGTARWTAEVDTPDGPQRIRSRWVHSATGYYGYDHGYTPDFAGQDDFAGDIVHPQHWPETLDVEGKEVVVIGSGATAVTLVPALVDRGARVTMLQRSPSYVLALPGKDPLAGLLRRRLGPRAAHRLVRWKNVLVSMALYQASRRAPRLVGGAITRAATRATAAAGVGPEHFTPRYDPWDQRMCFVPDGDLFGALTSGRARVVTDTIERFEPHGVRTSAGELLGADVVVSATGLALQAVGGASISVDGEPVDLSTRYLYRGLMVDEVPNFTISIGYTNASWTLRADLVAQYACRLINHVRATGAAYALARPSRPMPRRPALELTSGYIQRSIADFPKQGDASPWLVHQNYLRDRRDIGRADLTADMVFGPPATGTA